MRNSLKLGKGVEVDLSSRSRRLYHDEPSLWPWVVGVLLLLLGGGATYWYVQEREPKETTVIDYDTLTPQPFETEAEPSAVPEPPAMMEEPALEPSLPIAPADTEEDVVPLAGETPEEGVEEAKPASSMVAEPSESDTLENEAPVVERPAQGTQQDQAEAGSVAEQESEVSVVESAAPETLATPETSRAQRMTPQNSTSKEGRASAEEAMPEVVPLQVDEPPPNERTGEQGTRYTETVVIPPKETSNAPREAAKPEMMSEMPASEPARSENQTPAVETSVEPAPARATPAKAAEIPSREVLSKRESPMDPAEALLLRELWINDQLTQADRAYQSGDFAGAVRSLKRIVQRYPDSSDARSANEMIEQINETAEGLIR